MSYILLDRWMGYNWNIDNIVKNLLYLFKTSHRTQVYYCESIIINTDKIEFKLLDNNIPLKYGPYPINEHDIYKADNRIILSKAQYLNLLEKCKKNRQVIYNKLSETINNHKNNHYFLFGAYNTGFTYNCSKAFSLYEYKKENIGAHIELDGIEFKPHILDESIIKINLTQYDIFIKFKCIETIGRCYESAYAIRPNDYFDIAFRYVDLDLSRCDDIMYILKQKYNKLPSQFSCKWVVWGGLYRYDHQQDYCENIFEWSMYEDIDKHFENYVNNMHDVVSALRSFKSANWKIYNSTIYYQLINKLSSMIQNTNDIDCELLLSIKDFKDDTLDGIVYKKLLDHIKTTDKMDEPMQELILKSGNSDLIKQLFKKFPLECICLKK